MKKFILTLVYFVAAAALPCRAETIIALTSGNRLLFFQPTTPGTISRTLSVTNLQGGEILLGMDHRPATGQLYAIGSGGRLYTIDTGTGAATLVASLAADPADATSPFTALNGTAFGVDFNPVPDRLRVVSNAEQNLRINPANGLTTTDDPLAYAVGDPNQATNPNVVAAAYANNLAGATTTTLFGIDSNLDILVIQNPPNNGTLNTVAALGANTSDQIGFDISGVTGNVYASLTVGGAAGFYTINSTTGLATLVGAIDAATLGGEGVVDISVASPPRLLNISTRGRVGGGEDVLIAGFIFRGTESMNTLLRGIGPSLSSRGVSSPLANPVLTLFDSSGNMLTTNDDWRSTQETAITATGLAPTDNLEAAILTTLPPGVYTAILSGDDAGIGLVEVYSLP